MKIVNNFVTGAVSELVVQSTPDYFVERFGELCIKTIFKPGINSKKDEMPTMLWMYLKKEDVKNLIEELQKYV